jgi:hypothetical protein
MEKHTATKKNEVTYMTACLILKDNMLSRKSQTIAKWIDSDSIQNSGDL